MRGAILSSYVLRGVTGILVVYLFLWKLLGVLGVFRGNPGEFS